ESGRVSGSLPRVGPSVTNHRGGVPGLLQSSKHRVDGRRAARSRGNGGLLPGVVHLDTLDTAHALDGLANQCRAAFAGHALDREGKRLGARAVGRRCLARPSAENPGVAREEGHSGSNRRGEPEHGSGEAPEPRVKYGTSSAGGAGRPANVSQVESTPEEDRRSKEKAGPERLERGRGAGRRQPKGQEEERQPAA